MTPDNVSRDSAVVLKCELASDVLRTFGTLRFAATGWSMLPTIWPNDTLVVERVRPDQIHLGDIVLAHRENRLCAHRVISLPKQSANPQWITQGDAMPAPDLPLRAEELLGRVVSLIRGEDRFALSPKMGVIDNLIAITIRRSFFAARVLMYLHNLLPRGLQTPQEPEPSCQA